MIGGDPLVAEALRQVEALIADLGADHPEVAADERAWADTVEGETTATEIAVHLQTQALARQRLAEDAERQLADLKARATRFWAQAARYERGVLAILQASGLRKLETAAFDVVRRKAPVRVVVDEPALLPPEFWRQAEPQPDKHAIKSALQGQGSAAVPGARLAEGEDFLQVRTR